jgi:hypothetical protein
VVRAGVVCRAGKWATSVTGLRRADWGCQPAGHNRIIGKARRGSTSHTTAVAHAPAANFHLSANRTATQQSPAGGRERSGAPIRVCERVALHDETNAPTKTEALAAATREAPMTRSAPPDGRAYQSSNCARGECSVTLAGRRSTGGTTPRDPAPVTGANGTTSPRPEPGSFRGTSRAAPPVRSRPLRAPRPRLPRPQDPSAGLACWRCGARMVAARRRASRASDSFTVTSQKAKRPDERATPRSHSINILSRAGIRVYGESGGRPPTRRVRQ